MPEMNMSPVNIGQNDWNPAAALSNKLGAGSNSRAGRGGITSQLIQHGLNKDLASHVGKIQADLSSQDSGQRMKENAANNRHEIRKTILEHHQGLEKEAVVHTNSLERLRGESTAKISEGDAAHKNAVDLMKRLGKASSPGTDVAFKHGDVSASFTAKPKKEKTATTPVHTGQSFVGMPGYHVTTPAPAAAPSQDSSPKPLVKKGEKGKFASLKTPEEQAAAKKVKKSSKPAVTGPTVKKGPKGRFASLKD
jgi:hypothetical protein